MLSDVAELFDQAVASPAADRRITRRFIDAWARAARGQFPSWADLQERNLGADWEWIFAVDLKKSIGFPYFVFMGGKLSRLSDVHLSGTTDWTMSLIDKVTDDLYAAVAEEGPHTREETLALCDGRRIMLRAVTAPLADDGNNITHVAGAVSGRFADPGSDGLKLIS